MPEPIVLPRRASRQPRTYTLPIDLIARLDGVANTTNMDKSELVENAIRMYLDQVIVEPVK